MAALLRISHGFLRRHLSMTGRVLAALGIALLLYRLIVILPAYPSPWEAVAATAAFLVMVWSPPAGYFLVVFAAAFPLYSLSLYLAVLFLAVALLGQRVFIHNLGAILLVLSAPWLAQFHLEWLVVLLGGLWWGKRGGAWMGAAAALWGQLMFGMGGEYADWLANMGIAPTTSALVERFGSAGSLETLQLLVAPLAPNPTALLYHLLQVALWAAIGGLTGGLAERNWTQQKHPWRAIFVVFCAALGLMLGHLALAAWLEIYLPNGFSWIFPGLAESALYAALAASLLEAARDLVEHPLTAIRSPVRETPVSRTAVLTRRVTGWVRARRHPQAARAQTAPAEPVERASYTPLPVPENLPKRDPKKQPPDDIIKIELD